MKRLLLCVAVAGVAFATGSARADDEAPPPVPVTTFLLKHPGVDDPPLEPVMRALDDGLKKNKRLEMKDLETRLAEFAQEVPQDQIDEARKLLADGHADLTSLNLATAARRLTTAVDLLGKMLPYIKKQELADAMMALAAAQYEQGEKKPARLTMARLLTWRLDYKLDVDKYPPELLAPLEEVRKEVEHAKRGSLDIRSEPPSAQAYVDGKYIGVTPTFAEGLIVGEHYVTLKKEGYRKAVQSTPVSAKEQVIVQIPLDRSKKFLLVQQALDGVEPAIGQADLPQQAEDLKEVLFADHGVFVRARPGAAGMIDLELYLYDLRNKHLLATKKRSVAVGDATEQQLKGLTDALYTGVRYDAELEAPKDAPLPTAKKRKPVWKTWWFWTATGVVVLGVVAAGVAGAETAPKSCGGGNFCPGFTF